MEITADISKPLGLINTICHAFGSLNRPLLASLVLLFSPLSGLDCARADGLSQHEDNIVSQDEAMEPRIVNTVSEADINEQLLSADAKEEVYCLALNIYFEARSEPVAGQRAVGHVVMNRVAHPGYPDSVCQVVQQGGEEELHRCQFSWWCDGRSDKPLNQKAWDQALRVARDIYLGVSQDTTDGALWYHAIYVKPYWSDILLQGDRIGQHIFYLDKQQSRKTM